MEKSLWQEHIAILHGDMSWPRLKISIMHEKKFQRKSMGLSAVKTYSTKEIKQNLKLYLALVGMNTNVPRPVSQTLLTIYLRKRNQRYISFDLD